MKLTPKNGINLEFSYVCLVTNLTFALITHFQVAADDALTNIILKQQ